MSRLGVLYYYIVYKAMCGPKGYGILGLHCHAIKKIII